MGGLTITRTDTTIGGPPTVIRLRFGARFIGAVTAVIILTGTIMVMATIAEGRGNTTITAGITTTEGMRTTARETGAIPETVLTETGKAPARMAPAQPRQG